jgi:hypothetical protein
VKDVKTIKLGYLLLIIFGVAALIYLFATSLFVWHPQRLNVAVYGQNARVYSLGLSDNIDYIIPFYPDLKVPVPGGYGYYRVGGLGKLVHLERKPDIFRRTFSAATLSFVNYYFYPKNNDAIYYGAENTQGEIDILGVREFFLYGSNANFFDRLYLYLRLHSLSRNDLMPINPRLAAQQLSGDHQLSTTDFEKQYQGYLFSKTYRQEMKSVQIIYTKSYNTAMLLGSILQGNGIRVIDVSQKKKVDSNCVISENGTQFSDTAKDMAAFFSCTLVNRPSDFADIIMTLGSKEQEWEAK